MKQHPVHFAALIIAGFFLMALQPFTAAAQERSSCSTPSEVIVTLRPAQFGIPTVWDAVYGQQDNMVQMASAAPVEGGTVMAVGRLIAKKDFTPQGTVMVELNRRGRALAEKVHRSKDDETPFKMMPVKGGYLVLSNIRGGARKDRHEIKLSWYNSKGNFKKDVTLADSAYGYDADDLLPAAEGSGFTIAFHAVNYEQESDQHGALAQFTTDGRKLWQRAYRPGIPNEIYGVTRIDKDSYVAAGRIELDDGRMAGWAMKLGFDGTVLWQRTYPRGKSSVLRRAADGGGHSFLLAGDALPDDGGPDSLWMMKIDTLGNPQWERFIRRPDFALSTLGLRREEDGRIILAANAKALPDSGGRDHVRLLTMSLRGVIIQDESYIEGISAKANDFTSGWNGERIVTTTIKSDDKPLDMEMVGGKLMPVAAKTPAPAADEQPAEKKPPMDKGWIFVATALDPYADPCNKP